MKSPHMDIFCVLHILILCIGKNTLYTSVQVVQL